MYRASSELFSYSLMVENTDRTRQEKTSRKLQRHKACWEFTDFTHTHTHTQSKDNSLKMKSGRHHLEVRGKEGRRRRGAGLEQNTPVKTYGCFSPANARKPRPHQHAFYR